jgi:hypothetical protein
MTKLFGQIIKWFGPNPSHQLFTISRAIECDATKIRHVCGRCATMFLGVVDHSDGSGSGLSNNLAAVIGTRRSGGSRRGMGRSHRAASLAAAFRQRVQPGHKIGNRHLQRPRHGSNGHSRVRQFRNGAKLCNRWLKHRHPPKPLFHKQRANPLSATDKRAHFSSARTHQPAAAKVLPNRTTEQAVRHQHAGDPARRRVQPPRTIGLDTVRKTQPRARPNFIRT